MIMPTCFKILELIHPLKVGEQGKCFHHPAKNYNRTGYTQYTRWKRIYAAARCETIIFLYANLCMDCLEKTMDL